MAEIKRLYEPPGLIRYGNLATLTRSDLSCDLEDANKNPGSGDDLEGIQAVASPFICQS